MKATEIKSKMTQGEWKNLKNPIHSAEYIGVAQNVPTVCVVSAKNPNKEANAAAITTAVNNTYGKGVDPEAVESLLYELKHTLSMLERNDVTEGIKIARIENIKTAIARAEI